MNSALDAAELGDNPAASRAWARAESSADRGPILTEIARYAATLQLDDPLAAANIAISLRDKQQWAPAETILLRLLELHPDAGYAWYELAVQKALLGLSSEAVALARKALELEPETFRFRLTYALQLAKLGDCQEAIGVLAGTRPATLSEHNYLVYLIQFVRFVADYPEESAKRLHASISSQGSWLDYGAVEGAVTAAIASQTPFSLIRLGDGEGAWLHLDRADEASFTNLYDANRREFLRIWFGAEDLIASTDFFALDIKAVTERADIVGIPYVQRLEHEYRIFSPRGIPSCVNILREMETRLGAGSAAVCSHDIHLDLQLTGAFRRILAKSPEVGLITCHPGLADMVSANTGAVVSDRLLISGEKGFQHILGPEHVQEPHFPTGFGRIMQHLADKNLTGRVYLVAAGYLGKFYCDAVKGAGGIALDIGSVADGWAGKMTRPTLTELERFAL